MANDAAVVTYSGELVEIGMLDEGMGIRVRPTEDPNTLLTVIGLSIEDVRQLAPNFGDDVTVTVTRRTP